MKLYKYLMQSKLCYIFLLCILLSGCNENSNQYKQVQGGEQQVTTTIKEQEPTKGQEPTNEVQLNVKEGQVLTLKGACSIDLDQDGICEEISIRQWKEYNADHFEIGDRSMWEHYYDIYVNGEYKCTAGPQLDDTILVTSIDGDNVDVIFANEGQLYGEICEKDAIYRYQDHKFNFIDYLYCDRNQLKIIDHKYIGYSFKQHTILNSFKMPTNNCFKDGKIECTYLPITENETDLDILDVEYKLDVDLDLRTKLGDEEDSISWKRGTKVKPIALITKEPYAPDNYEAFEYWLCLRNLETKEEGWIFCHDYTVYQKNKSENPDLIFQDYDPRHS